MAWTGVSFGSMPPPGNTQTGTSRLWIKRTELLSGEKMAPATLSGCSIRVRVAVFFLLYNLALSGCSSHYLAVQQERIGRKYLASTHVDTPDPRQENPPRGHKLLISWDFPRSLYDKHLTLTAKVRFWDDEQEVLIRPIERKRGYADFYFPDKKILTYRIEVQSKEGEVVSLWEHQLWTELIDVDKASAAQRRRSSVSSQPKQLSVTETP
jgi:hypothetical protein